VLEYVTPGTPYETSIWNWYEPFTFFVRL